ncbi:rhomboid family intramembrane serine protease [Chitinophaga sp. Cy-1792]|uniref:rhomboid family intramembrane serine protease n=1 Tax=Chitinophaga sp. Cy-1792 TaxID=2608339 RepID=UPI0014206E7B|nr:rhomboid family intramembrane serine protease [Chitinophaga sp. Cy-1792]NIG56257.1 rhomboid family intramembrane serine protease [Chitinophaga sp. Cy-1792]
MSTTLILIIITCVISLTSLNNGGQWDKLAMKPYNVRHNNEWYRMITGGFVHVDMMHLFFNMLTLYFFGSYADRLLTGITDTRATYLFFYLIAIVVGNIPDYFKYKDYSGFTSCGASGAVSATLFTSILIAPWQMIGVFFIPVPGILFAVLYLAYSSYMAKRGGDNIGHAAHLWGSIFGFIAPIFLDHSLLQHFIDALLRR